MSVLITFFITCPHCDGEARGPVTLDLTQPDDGPIQIDAEMAVCQETFTCGGCGCEFYTGDLDVADEVGDSCPGDQDDEDDEEEASE